MGKNLYIGNLAYSVDNQKLEEKFGEFGTVASAKVITDRESGRSKGFGFVEMGSDEDAANAISSLDGSDFDGRALRVSEAKPREDNNRGGGFGGNRY